MTITTESWVLYSGHQDPTPGHLRQEAFNIPALNSGEVLIEPLYGCWEANMEHALLRQPIDICEFRHEKKVVIGNAGVARVLEVGEDASELVPGMVCLVLASTQDVNQYGYPRPAYAYDAPDTIGLLAKQTKVQACQLVPLPEDTRYSLEQWAAFSLRYLTAWGNWRVAYQALRLMLSQEECSQPQVWAWGGGVALAQLELAQFEGCAVTMVASRDKRIEQLKQQAIQVVDRRHFPHLVFNAELYQSDSYYRTAYLADEKRFLKFVREQTNGQGVAIFIDYIGEPVYRASLKALGCPGIITTAGWKHGMQLSTNRALECMNWHTHIHTHYVRRQEALEAVSFAEKTGWLPRDISSTYSWDNIPRLVEDYRQGMDSYFPIYQVNAL